MNLRKSVLPFVPLLGVSRVASAEPLNTWGLHPGKGVFGLVPYLYAGPTTGVQPLVYGEYGVTNEFAMAGAPAKSDANLGAYLRDALHRERPVGGDVGHRHLDEPQERADRLVEVRDGRVLEARVRDPRRRLREHHHRR
jgi:hypothetical protein